MTVAADLDLEALKKEALKDIASLRQSLVSLSDALLDATRRPYASFEEWQEIQKWAGAKDRVDAAWRVLEYAANVLNGE